MMHNISFRKNDVRFNLRVAGVALHRGRVLLHRALSDDFWALPGGRVSAMEASPLALRREMEEELHTGVSVGRLLFVIENFYLLPEPNYHEIGFYYQFDLPPDCPLLAQETFEGAEDDGMKLIFRWFPQVSIPGLDVRPVVLREALANLPKGVQHFINDER